MQMQLQLQLYEFRRNKNRAWLKFWFGAMAWSATVSYLLILAGGLRYGMMLAAPFVVLGLVAATFAMFASFGWMSYERAANAPPRPLKAPKDLRASRQAAPARTRDDLDEFLAEQRAG